MRHSFFSREGLALSVSEAGSGQPFVFQHGLCGAAGQPLEVFPEESMYRCVTLECRGHGGSQAGPPDRFSIVTFAEDVAAFIDSLKAGPLVLGGISMGAAISLHLAIKRPDLVKALVLARPAWLAETHPENIRPHFEVGELLKQGSPQNGLARFKQSETAKMLAHRAPDNLKSLLGFFEREPVDVTAQLLTRISSSSPGITRANIRTLNLPTLVIGHDRDFVHPLKMAEDLASLIPTARLAVITPKADDPTRYRADFRAALSHFLKELA